MKKLSQECECHIDTVYDAVAKAIEIGILAKFDLTTCFGQHPSTAQALFNRRVTLKWLGDTPHTAGEEVFDERESVQNFSTDSFLASQNPGKNPGYTKEKESLLREKEKGLVLTFKDKDAKPCLLAKGLASSQEPLHIPPNLSFSLQKSLKSFLDKQGVEWKN